MLLNYVEQDYNYILKKKNYPNHTHKRTLFRLQKQALWSFKMPEIELPEQFLCSTVCMYALWYRFYLYSDIPLLHWTPGPEPSGRNWVYKSLLYFFLILFVLCAFSAWQSYCQLLLIQQNPISPSPRLKALSKDSHARPEQSSSEVGTRSMQTELFFVAQYHVKTASVPSAGSEDIWCPSAEDMVRMKRGWWRASLPPESHRSFSCLTLPMARLVQNKTAGLCSKLSCARNPIHQFLSPLP